MSKNLESFRYLSYSFTSHLHVCEYILTHVQNMYLMKTSVFVKLDVFIFHSRHFSTCSSVNINLLYIYKIMHFMNTAFNSEHILQIES